MNKNGLDTDMTELIRIGNVWMHCDSLKAVGGRNFREETLIGGESFSSAAPLTGLRLTIKGRIIDEEHLVVPFINIYSVLRSDSEIELQYKDFQLTGCHINKLVVNDENKGYLDVTLTLVSYSHPIFAEEMVE